MASWGPLRLALHPDSRCQAVERIDVLVATPESGRLALRYVLTGDVARLKLPESAPPGRADKLWTQTCFEAFVREEEGYTEFNFSPSTQWAAYRFDRYREGMRTLEVQAPHIAARAQPHAYELSATIPAPSATARLGFSVVVQQDDGALSYWGLAHPPGKPDFHHDDSFAFQLSTGTTA